jgi:hypothetical protein
LLLLVLSIDEVASVHERMGSWTALAPFGLVLCLLAAFACMTLWRVPEERAKAQWILVALSLFASVAGQEHLENQSQWWGAFDSLRAFVEEGTEIGAMVLLLWVTMRKSGGMFDSRGCPGPVFEGLVRAPMALLVAGLTIAPIFVYLAIEFAHPERGNPALWLAAASLFSAALCAARDYPAYGVQPGWAQWAMALLCLLLSFGAMRLSPTLGQLSQLLLAAAPLLICALWYFSFEHARKSKRLFFASAAIAVFALGSWFSTSAWTVHLGYMAVAVLILYGNGLLAQGLTVPNAVAPRARRFSTT